MARKARRLFESKFIVEGFGAFPLDMLRYDCCFPDAEGDVAAIKNEHEVRQVRLRRRSVDEGPPEVRRWESYRWRVVDVEHF